MPDYQLGVIGGGNVAEAILRGVVGRSVLNHNVIVVAEPMLERRQRLLHDLQVTCVADRAVAAACPHVLLAVKPQAVGDVLDRVAGALRDDALVICVAAGVPTALLDRKLSGRGRIVRAAPATLMLIGAGMTAIAAGPRATDADLHWAENLFAACGKVVRVAEEMIDAAAGVSASGPACFLYLIEAMIAAGVAEGLDRDVAAQLATQTCAGAARLLAETREPPHVLRARLTSPGGLAQQAIETLDAGGVKGKLIEAVRAAAARSREMQR
jgi:pyrroline-5-carboxylate reductase